MAVHTNNNLQQRQWDTVGNGRPVSHDALRRPPDRPVRQPHIPVTAQDHPVGHGHVPTRVGPGSSAISRPHAPGQELNRAVGRPHRAVRHQHWAIAAAISRQRTPEIRLKGPSVVVQPPLVTRPLNNGRLWLSSPVIIRTALRDSHKPPATV